MEVDNGLLGKLTAGGEIESNDWPQLRAEMIDQLDKIARNEFPIPKLPPPVDPRTRPLSPLPSSPLERTSSQETDKENAPAKQSAALASEASAPAVQQLEPGELPKQIMAMLDGIIAHLKTFETHPPHTIQRLSELVLRPRAHYKALAPYLHAVDRVVHVTSSTNIYPLPPAIPDMTSMNINGDGVADPAAAVGWANPTNGSAAAADEALGGALLTPIPWLNRLSPESNNGDSSSNGGGSSGAQIHSESTETIDGPNGVGSIETVSVSINGVPSTGHTRGVTQGELLRQEQRAGVVPVSQLSRNQNGHEHNPLPRSVQEEEEGMQAEEGEESVHQPEGEVAEEEEETPHARGPDEIGAGDIGPQSVSTSFVGEGGLDSHDIDVEAAVGRKHDVEQPSAAVAEGEEEEEEKAEETGEDTDATDSAAGTKRGPEETEGEGVVKKLKEGDEMETEETK